MSMFRSLIRGIKNPKKIVTLISYKLLSTVGHNNYKRFIVLSRSRTGSNMLISFLDSHSNIHAEGEIFSKLSGRNHKNVLAKVFAKQPFYVKAKGFKIFYYHPQDDKSSGIWNDLTSMDDLYVIHLKRRNILRTMISRQIADIQDVWATDQHSAADSKEIAIAFTVDELIEGFNQVKAWEQTGDDMFRNHPLISIDYEDLVSNPEQTFRKVTEFLGVQNQQPETKLRKQNIKSMRETVTNYEELKSAFSGTEWQQFFDD